MNNATKPAGVRTDGSSVNKTGTAGGRNGSPEGYEGHGTARDAVTAPTAAVEKGAPAEQTHDDAGSAPRPIGGAGEKASEPTE